MGRGEGDIARIRHVLLPSIAAALLPFGLLWLPPDHWDKVPLIVAAAATVVISLSAVRAPWSRLPAWGPSVLPFAYLVVVGLLRVAGKNSGIAPMALLPVFWIALCGTRRLLWVMLAATATVLVLPLRLEAGVAAGSWQTAALFITVSGLVGVTVQVLVSRVQEQALERDRLLEQLHGLAHTDELTGLPNRRAWEAALDRGLTRAVRTGRPLTVALIDIDNFKDINDRCGHAQGDALLSEISERWTAALRQDDVLARIGGDEFALLIPRLAPDRGRHRDRPAARADARAAQLFVRPGDMGRRRGRRAPHESGRPGAV